MKLYLIAALSLIASLLLSPAPAAASSLFKSCGVSGSVTLYDSATRRWFYTDKADAARRTLPASTFKILHSLIALDSHVVKDENEVLKWDGVPRLFPVWNHDTNMREAFKNSTIWFYEEMEKNIPRDTYVKTLHAISYGDDKLDQPGNFWVYGDFGVSPIDQILMLRALQAESLPFTPQSMHKLKDFMCDSADGFNMTCSKTGWTTKDNTDIGWWVGYRQQQDHTVFFATRLQKTDDDMDEAFLSCRKTITAHYLNKFFAKP